MQITHHTADHMQLLIILFPKNRQIGLNNIKQLADNRGDTTKMPGPDSTKQSIGKLRGLNNGL